jgi:CBS domain-containing protein
VTTDTLLCDVAGLMAEHRVGAVVVLNADRLTGILTERDIVFRAVARGLSADTTTASEVMTPEPVTLGIDEAISDALAAKLGDAFRHLPVLENGAVVGILSYRDIPAEYVMLFERFREMSTARADEDV